MFFQFIEVPCDYGYIIGHRPCVSYNAPCPYLDVMEKFALPAILYTVRSSRTAAAMDLPLRTGAARSIESKTLYTSSLRKTKQISCTPTIVQNVVNHFRDRNNAWPLPSQMSNACEAASRVQIERAPTVITNPQARYTHRFAVDNQHCQLISRSRSPRINEMWPHHW